MNEWELEVLEIAEKISMRYHKEKIAIISGIGVRDYYRKRGYKLDGTYMIKKIVYPVANPIIIYEFCIVVILLKLIYMVFTRYLYMFMDIQ